MRPPANCTFWDAASSAFEFPIPCRRCPCAVSLNRGTRVSAEGPRQTIDSARGSPHLAGTPAWRFQPFLPLKSPSSIGIFITFESVSSDARSRRPVKARRAEWQ
jgi:hypothetical protein